MSNVSSFSVNAPVWNIVSKGGSSSSSGAGGETSEGVVYNYEVISEGITGISEAPPLTYLDVSSDYTFSLADGTEGGVQKVLQNKSSYSSTWSALGLGTNNIIRALTVYNGEIYIGGEFATVGAGVSANFIAKYNPSTRVWSALGLGVNNSVYALTVYNGEIYVGGRFTTAGPGVSASRIAKYNPSTGEWSALGSGFTNNIITALTVYNGEIYVGGQFTTLVGIAAIGVGKYNPASEIWSPLGSGLSGGGNYVNVFEVYNEVIYVGGNFTAAGGVASNNMAKYIPASNSWAAFGSGVAGNVFALTVYNGEMYVGGRFLLGSAVINIAKYNPNTGVGVQLPSNTNNTILSLTVYNGEIYAGGQFTTAGEFSANRIAKYNPITGLWAALGSGVSTGLQPFVNALVVYNRNIYAGGGFTNAGGISANRIAKYGLPTVTVNGSYFYNNSSKTSIDLSNKGSAATLVWNPVRSVWVPQAISDATF